jgi:hypothetical protein
MIVSSRSSAAVAPAAPVAAATCASSGAWLFAERLLYVDWLDDRMLA